MNVHPVVVFDVTVMFAGHVITGTCVSTTVTVKLHVEFGEFGDASDAVHTTVVTPTGNAEPDAGVHTIVAPGQLSVAVAVYVTTAEHVPVAAATEIGAGHVACGASVSCTVTVNEQLLVLFEASVAVQVTTVDPTGNVDPDAGVQLTVVPGQLSEVVGAA